MTHQDIAIFAESWGMVSLFVMFVVGVGYVFWPAHRAKFIEAAKCPLDEE